MSARQVELGADIAGPKTLDTRYVLEDVHFGLPLHRSGVTILSACYRKDSNAHNDLLPAITDLEEGLRS